MNGGEFLKQGPAGIHTVKFVTYLVSNLNCFWRKKNHFISKFNLSISSSFLPVKSIFSSQITFTLNSYLFLFYIIFANSNWQAENQINSNKIFCITNYKFKWFFHFVFSELLMNMSLRNGINLFNVKSKLIKSFFVIVELQFWQVLQGQANY